MLYPVTRTRLYLNLTSAAPTPPQQGTRFGPRSRGRRCIKRTSLSILDNTITLQSITQSIKLIPYQPICLLDGLGHLQRTHSCTRTFGQQDILHIYTISIVNPLVPYAPYAYPRSPFVCPPSIPTPPVLVLVLMCGTLLDLPSCLPLHRSLIACPPNIMRVFLLDFLLGLCVSFVRLPPFILFSSFVFYFFTSLFYVPLLVSLLLVFLTSNIHLPITLLPILLTLPSPILHLTQTLFRSPFLRYALGLR